MPEVQVTVRACHAATLVEHDVDVRWDSDATVGELVAALADALADAFGLHGGKDRALLVDGRCLPTGLTLGTIGLARGDVVELSAEARSPWPEAGGDPVATLAVEGCLDSGAMELSAGLHRPRPDLLVAVGDDGALHVADLGGRAPEAWTQLIPGPSVVIADRRLAVGAAPKIGRRHGTDVGGDGTRRFHRGPRHLPPPVEPVVVPTLPAAEPEVAGGALTLAGPVLSAGAMVAVTGEPRYALVGIAAPLALGAAGLWRRRGRRRRSRERDAAVRDLVARFEGELARAGGDELRRRERLTPGPAAVVGRAVGATAGVWERAPRHGAGEGFLELRVGLGDLPWDPPMFGIPEPGPLASAASALSVLPDAPVAVDLAPGEAVVGGVLGLAGPREAVSAVARWLVLQAATLHGPADLGIDVVVSEGADVGEWAWAAWLPHHREAQTAGGPARLTLVDGGGLDHARHRGGVVVLAASAAALPASCDAILIVDAEGHGVLERPRGTHPPVALAVEGLDAASAARCGRALAALADPDLDAATGAVPAAARLVDLLGLAPAPSPDAIAARWSREGGRCRVPIGVGPGGAPVVVDLAADGPHLLVGGTTGAGKSELLRTLVAGLAASADPDEVTFVLIDFKGGSAFDACAGLPHTVGLVTDLDPLLAERALRSLDAELRHRERVLRSVGAADRGAYRAAGSPKGPLPRLVVVVDEFATLKVELPGFVDALVGIAQRGRSLGIHLVLATQRPAGVVSEDIRANTAIRIALRTQSAADSEDVIGSGIAATVPRAAPGRGHLRLGPGEVVEVQTARSSGATPPPECRLVVRPIGSPWGPSARPGAEAAGSPGPSDLEVLVAAVQAAAARHVGPRRPWLPPLPATLPLWRLAPAGPPTPCADLADAVAFGIADDPDAQRQLAAAWCPSAGHLLVVGALGSGTTTTLAATALAAAWDAAPDRCHLHVVDLGPGHLAPLERLPHCAGVIGPGQPDRLARLIRLLAAELHQRSAGTGDRPAVILVVDGYPTLEATLRDVAGEEAVDQLREVLARGAEVGIHAVIGTDRVGGLPAAVSAPIAQRLLLPLAHPTEYVVAGVDGRRLVGAPPGRGILAGSGLLVQVGQPWPSPAEAATAIAARHRPPAVPPPTVHVLASRIPIAEVLVEGPCPGLEPPGTRALPIGRREHDLAVAALAVGPGEQALVAGGARSGKTTALVAVATAALARRPGQPVIVLAPARSPLAASIGAPSFGPDEVAKLAIHLDEVAVAGEGVLLLVDDADDIPDAEGVLDRLATGARPDVCMVATGRPEGLRAGYGHWTRALRRHRLGLLLQPAELDGDLLGVVLPRRPVAAMVPGRGYLVRGTAVELVQVAVT